MVNVLSAANALLEQADVIAIAVVNFRNMVPSPFLASFLGPYVSSNVNNFKRVSS